jgi:hypothetical protein
MKVLTKDAAASLLNAGAVDTFVRLRSEQLHLAGPAYTIPSDTGAKTALAKFLAYLLLKQPEVCVYLTGWSLRPCSEHLDLFYGYRLAAGEMRPLSEAPVHVFDRTANDALVSVLCMVFYFALDACVFDLEGKTMIRIGHDGRIEIRADHPGDIVDFAANPEKYLTPFVAIAA